MQTRITSSYVKLIIYSVLQKGLLNLCFWPKKKSTRIMLTLVFAYMFEVLDEVDNMIHLFLAVRFLENETFVVQTAP